MVDEEITERMVEGIYAESQYKIENIPGYAEAFERCLQCFRDVIDGKPADSEKFTRAVFDLMVAEFKADAAEYQGRR